MFIAMNHLQTWLRGKIKGRVIPCTYLSCVECKRSLDFHKKSIYFFVFSR